MCKICNEYESGTESQTYQTLQDFAKDVYLFGFLVSG